MNLKNLELIQRPVPPAKIKLDVLAGLKSTPKKIPGYLLYDDRGSELFEQICETPEYYVTRAESEILEDHGSRLAELLGDKSTLIEPGAGNLRKAEILLKHVRAATYCPIDISGDHLRKNASRLALSFPHVQVQAVLGSFSMQENWSTIIRPENRNVLFFPGSTIGNLEPPEVPTFLSTWRHMLGPQAAAIIGVDQKKDIGIINAAYNDSKGITAEFEKNVLVRINRELGGNFDLSNFNYKGFYDHERGRVEMHLESKQQHTVNLSTEAITFDKSELIRIENSYKYSIPEFHFLARISGWSPVATLTDQRSLFSVYFLEPSQRFASPIVACDCRDIST